MPRCWVVRTDFSRLEDVILPSLETGVLRQGWSYLPEQDLNIVGPIVYESGRQALTEDQQATWRRVQRFWPDHWEPVRIGDWVLLPKVPTWGHWRLVEVTGTYSFSRHPDSGDHGHTLPVKTLVADIASSNVSVGAGLQRTMRNQGPMWNIDALADEVERLLVAGQRAATPHGPSERLAGLLANVLGDVRTRLSDGFKGNQLEEPVHRLLQQLVPGGSVKKTAGSAEHGADFTVTETDVFGHERRTVIQLKDHDVLNDDRALSQIREAHSWYAPVGAAAILTTAFEEDSEFARAREALSDELGIPITAVLGDQLARWFLVHLEALAAD